MYIQIEAVPLNPMKWKNISEFGASPTAERRPTIQLEILKSSDAMELFGNQSNFAWSNMVYQHQLGKLSFPNVFIPSDLCYVRLQMKLLMIGFLTLLEEPAKDSPYQRGWHSQDQFFFEIITWRRKMILLWAKWISCMPTPLTLTSSSQTAEKPLLLSRISPHFPGGWMMRTSSTRREGTTAGGW